MGPKDEMKRIGLIHEIERSDVDHEQFPNNKNELEEGLKKEDQKKIIIDPDPCVPLDDFQLNVYKLFLLWMEFLAILNPIRTFFWVF